MLALTMLIAGCAAPFYQAQSILLSADSDLISTTQGELSDHCIINQSIPKEYQLRRSTYTLFLEVDAQQLFILPELNKELNEAPNKELTEKTNEKPNNLPAKIHVEVNNQKATEIPLSIEGNTTVIEVLVYNEAKVIGREKIKLEKVSCLALQKR